MEKAIKNLREKNILTKQAILTTDTKKIAQLIRSSGYHNQKARKLKELAKFDGEINRENLLSIWGIGKETADSILLYAYDKPHFVIDNYTKRIFNRIGYKEKSYKDLQNLFVSNLPKDIGVYKEYHALIVELAKNNCKKKPECEGCALKSMCRFRDDVS